MGMDGIPNHKRWQTNNNCPLRASYKFFFIFLPPFCPLPNGAAFLISELFFLRQDQLLAI